MIYDILYECEERTKDGHIKHHLRCRYCGKEVDMRIISAERTKRCRHTNKFGVDFANMNNLRLKKILYDMLDRCTNPANLDFKNYGAKGINVCEEWTNNPELFERWALENGYANNLTIDRIDWDKGYSPENCRWVTREDNARYKPTTNYITVGDRTMSGREWSKFLNVGTNRINRIMRNYGEDVVITFIENQLKKQEENDSCDKMAH